MKNFSKIFTVIFMCNIISLWAAPLDNMVTDKVSVGVAATEIVPANYKRKEITLYNDSANIIYIDNIATDCTIDSFPLVSSGTIKIEGYQGSIFGIVETTTSTVKVMYLQY